MQLPDPPPSKRSLWQTSAYLGSMIAFLVFSDWANPSQTIITKTDGTQLQVAVLLETTEMFRVQVEEPVGDLKKGQKLIIPKSEIAESEYRRRRRATSGRPGSTCTAGISRSLSSPRHC